MPSIMRRMITTDRFRFNLSPQDALDILSAFYCAEVKARHQKVSLDEMAAQNLIHIANFITSSAPKFGMLLCGNVGNGKTTMMKAFQRCVNHLENINHFSFLDDKEFGRQYHAEMRIVDVREIIKAAKEDPKKLDAIRKINILGIDDFGKEQTEVLDYGNVIAPVVELLEYRYDKQLFTIITTNLTPAEIKSKYRERIADRFSEMFEKIVFKNSSYRKSLL